jgi:transposase-like protein
MVEEGYFVVYQRQTFFMPLPDICLAVRLQQRRYLFRDGLPQVGGYPLDGRVILISGVWQKINKERILLECYDEVSNQQWRDTLMNKDTTILDSGRAPITDELSEFLRKGARELLFNAVQAELDSFLEEYAALRTDDGRKAVARNGFLPQRKAQTGIGDIEVRVPKVRDRSNSGIKFNSALLPPYLKRTKSVEEMLPWLYLKGVSTGEYQEALNSLLGKDAPGLSPNTISRLKSKWLGEYNEWRRRDLSDKKYVYWWADGVYSNVRMDDKLCLLVIIGATEDGIKELIAVEDGHRESCDSWYALLADLRSRGLQIGPKLATGDGAMVFWKALSMAYPDALHQRCWVHKTANVLEKLPKSMQGKVKSSIRDIWMAPCKKEAEKAFDLALEQYSAKYPKAMDCLGKNRTEMLAFYDFPAEHWIHIRTSNPIESAFSTIRLRTAKMRNCGSRETTLSMVFKLAESAEKRWKRLQGHKLLCEVISGVKFKDGIRESEQSDRSAA